MPHLHRHEHRPVALVRAGGWLSNDLRGRHKAEIVLAQMRRLRERGEQQIELDLTSLRMCDAQFADCLMEGIRYQIPKGCESSRVHLSACDDEAGAHVLHAHHRLVRHWPRMEQAVPLMVKGGACAPLAAAFSG